MISYDTKAVWVADLLALLAMVSCIWIGYDARSYVEVVAPLIRLAGVRPSGLYLVLEEDSGVFLGAGTLLIGLTYPWIRIIIGEWFGE